MSRLEDMTKALAQGHLFINDVMYSVKGVKQLGWKGDSTLVFDLVSECNCLTSININNPNWTLERPLNEEDTTCIKLLYELGHEYIGVKKDGVFIADDEGFFPCKKINFLKKLGKGVYKIDDDLKLCYIRSEIDC